MSSTSESETRAFERAAFKTSERVGRTRHTFLPRELRNVFAIFRRQQLHVEAEKMGSYALLQLAEWKSLFS